MRTSRKAIVLLMAGAMLLAATAGAFAQGFGGGNVGPGAVTPGYGYNYWYWYGYQNENQAVPGFGPYGNGQQRGGGHMNSQRGFIGPQGAQGPQMPQGPMMGPTGMRGQSGFEAFSYYQYQKLSAEDKAKVEKIVQDAASQILPLQNEVRSERLLLNNLLWSASPDKAKVDESISKISDLQKQIQEIRADSIIEVNKIFQANQ